MGTDVSPEIQAFANGWQNDCGYKSAVLAGIRPNQAHLKSGGFHCSLVDLIAHGNGGDYSNVRIDDKGFNPAYGAAVDMALAKADMVLLYTRVHAVWADRGDPRRKYVNAVNCWDGSGDATRFDFDANVAKYASPDHQTHSHAEVHRRYVRVAKAIRAVLSMFKGESKAAWIAREETPTKTPEDDVNWDDTFDSPSWAARAGKNPPTYSNALILGAIWAKDAVNGVNAALTQLLQAYAAQDHVDEQALGQSIGAALAPAILAGLPDSDLTVADVEQAVRNVLRAGVGTA